MTKVAIITDTHFGARGDKTALLDHFKEFYEQTFFPELEKRGIDTFWHLGDLVDRRKFINYHTLQVMKDCFLDRLENYDAHIILGNHDMYYKNVVEPNALTELLGEYKFQTYSRPTIVKEQDITVIPYVCDETAVKASRMINAGSTRYCFGHLQIKNFEMDRGRFAQEGQEMDGFRKFDMVLTGHFHHKSSFNNIHYLGAPYEMTWRDYKDGRGFHILDTDTGELEYIENQHRLFHKFVYNDENTDLPTLLSEVNQRTNLKDGFVKVIIKSKNNSFWFDTFIDKINETGVSDLQISDDHYNLNVDTDDVILEQAEDTLTILNKYIDSAWEVNCDSEKLKNLLKELYDEAAFLRIS